MCLLGRASNPRSSWQFLGDSVPGQSTHFHQLGARKTNKHTSGTLFSKGIHTCRASSLSDLNGNGGALISTGRQLDTFYNAKGDASRAAGALCTGGSAPDGRATNKHDRGFAAPNVPHDDFEPQLWLPTRIAVCNGVSLPDWLGMQTMKGKAFYCYGGCLV